MEVTMDTDQSHLILKKSWDIALGPIKQVSHPFDPFFITIDRRIDITIHRKIELISLSISTGTNEFVNNVHVRKFDFNISNNDGGHDAGASDKGDHRHTSHIQSNRRYTSGRAKDCVFLRKFGECRVSRV